MLTESQVIEAVCNHLAKGGWHIDSTCREAEHGIDIVATRGDAHLYVEAKGETSSMAHTSRHGKPFTSGQVLAHVSRAQSAVAFPRNAAHKKVVAEIGDALEKLSIPVYWVNADLSVQVEGVSNDS